MQWFTRDDVVTSIASNLDNLLTFDQWHSDTRAIIDCAIDQRFATGVSVNSVLEQAMVYACAGGGKRMRALLVLASAICVGLDAEALLPAACAVEAMHAYSLVHDDLPCMDNDNLRRGKPTCHVVYGQAMALLAGDALQTLAFEWLSDSSLTQSVRLSQIQCLARASGGRGMAGGQAIDLLNVNRDLSLNLLKQMHAYKTGALFEASVLLGAMANESLSEKVYSVLSQFAKSLGLAFQVIDDILDVEVATEDLGKTAGKDMQSNKPTMVSILGLDQAKALSRQLFNEALNQLGMFDSRADYLKGLVRQVVERRS